jgi:hypothetical protein
MHKKQKEFVHIGHSKNGTGDIPRAKGGSTHAPSRRLREYCAALIGFCGGAISRRSGDVPCAIFKVFNF